MSEQDPSTVIKEDNADAAVGKRSGNVESVLIYLVPSYILAISVSYLGVYPFAKFSGIDPLAAASLLASFIIFVVCLALHSYLYRESTRAASAISAAVMVVTYFTYLWSISASRGLSVFVMPLFDVLCGSTHCSVSLDLGQVGIIAVFYLLKDRIVSLMRRSREP